MKLDRPTVVVLTGMVVVAGIVLASSAFAQGVPDAQALVVTSPAPKPEGLTATGGDFTWPLAAYGVVHRFLAVLERMVTDTRAWFDRVLDVTKGRIRVDHKKTIVNWTDTGEGPEDITGPIPRPRRRRDDPGRNGALDDEDAQ